MSGRRCARPCRSSSALRNTDPTIVQYHTALGQAQLAAGTKGALATLERARDAVPPQRRRDGAVCGSADAARPSEARARDPARPVQRRAADRRISARRRRPRTPRATLPTRTSTCREYHLMSGDLPLAINQLRARAVGAQDHGCATCALRRHGWRKLRESLPKERASREAGQQSRRAIAAERVRCTGRAAECGPARRLTEFCGRIPFNVRISSPGVFALRGDALIGARGILSWTRVHAARRRKRRKTRIVGRVQPRRLQVQRRARPRHAFKPVAKGYEQDHVPALAPDRHRQFFHKPRLPRHGREPVPAGQASRKAGQARARFLINTTLGFGGLFDVASGAHAAPCTTRIRPDAGSCGGIRRDPT